MSRLRSLEDTLQKADQFPWRHALYLPSEQTWDLNTLGAVLDPADVDNPDDAEDIPIFAKEKRLRYVLMMSDIQQIVANVYEQQANATSADLFHAFKHYFHNDAFIDFAKEQP